MTDDLNALAEDFRPAETDVVKRARMFAIALQELRQELTDLEARAETVKAAINKLEIEDLPAAMDEAGVDSLGVPAHGNYPAFDIEINPVFEGGIPASWPDDRRQAALEAMESYGYGDLIKVELAVRLPKGQIDVARSIQDVIETDYGYTPEVKQTIHTQTFRGWLRDAYKRGLTIPPLEVIGGFVGRKAKIKERDE